MRWNTIDEASRASFHPWRGAQFFRGKIGVADLWIFFMFSSLGDWSRFCF